MLRVASLFTDGAVLCRQKEIRIFGEAEDGAEVTLPALAQPPRRPLKLTELSIP